MAGSRLLRGKRPTCSTYSWKGGCCLQTDKPEAEWSILGAFFLDPKEAGAASVNLRREMFSNAAYGQIFETMSEMFARDEAVDPVTLMDRLPAGDWAPVISDLMDVPSAKPSRSWAAMIDKAYKSRRFVELLDLSKNHVLKGTHDGGRVIAHRLTDVVASLYSPTISVDSREEIVDDLIAMTTAEDSLSVDVPIHALNKQIGPLVPELGEFIGITAYSGGGKSTFALNLALGFLLQQQPVILFPTEMGKRAVQRMAAAWSMTSQMRAEKNVWRYGPKDTPSEADVRAVERERLAYVAALQGLRDMPHFEVVLSPNISPRDVIARARILKRRFEKPPVVIVDHLHRLDYGGAEANKMVGPAAKMFKNFAVTDECIVIGLFQPKKPDEAPDMSHVPISMYQIRGASEVANELDVHMSVYRPYVFDGLTEANGDPKEARNKDQAGVYQVDTHMKVLPDKRRIGGAGSGIWLPFESKPGLVPEVIDVS